MRRMTMIDDADGDFNFEDNEEWEYKLPKIHSCYYKNILKETDKAFCFDYINDSWYNKELKNVWLPKKQIEIVLNERKIWIPLWLYKKKIKELYPKTMFITN